MRIENQKQATADQPYPTSSRPGHINIGLLSTQRDPYAAARLSISCPSLNNSLSAMGKEGVYANPMNENNNYVPNLFHVIYIRMNPNRIDIWIYIL